MLRSRKYRCFIVYGIRHTNFETFKRLYKLGLPQPLNNWSGRSVNWCAQLYAGLLGIVVLAAHQVFVRVQSVLTMAFQGFGLASMSLVGRIGAGDDDAAIKAGWQTGWVALATAMLIGAGLMLTEQWWFSIFTKKAVVTFGTSAVIVLAIIQMPKAMNMVFTGNLRGGGDLNWLMWLAISSVTILKLSVLTILHLFANYR